MCSISSNLRTGLKLVVTGRTGDARHHELRYLLHKRVPKIVTRRGCIRTSRTMVRLVLRLWKPVAEDITNITIVGGENLRSPEVCVPLEVHSSLVLSALRTQRKKYLPGYL